MAIKSRDEGLSGIIGQILNIPVTCHPQFFPKTKYAYTSYEENKGAPIVDSKQMYWFWGMRIPNTVIHINYIRSISSKSRKRCISQSTHCRIVVQLTTSIDSSCGSVLSPSLRPYLTVIGMDPLRDEGKAYAEALKNSGVDVTLNLYPGLPHGFSAYPHLTKSPIYHQSVVDWINKNFTGA